VDERLSVRDQVDDAFESWLAATVLDKALVFFISLGIALALAETSLIQALGLGLGATVTSMYLSAGGVIAAFVAVSSWKGLRYGMRAFMTPLGWLALALGSGFLGLWMMEQEVAGLLPAPGTPGDWGVLVGAWWLLRVAAWLVALLTVYAVMFGLLLFAAGTGAGGTLLQWGAHLSGRLGASVYGLCTVVGGCAALAYASRHGGTGRTALVIALGGCTLQAVLSGRSLRRCVLADRVGP
jgi:hypothetical protein